MPGSPKKAILRTLSGAIHFGYLATAEFVHIATVEWMSPDGRANSLALKDIYWIAYVRDFNLDDTSAPERLERRTFPSRPRVSGLWLRIQMNDDVVLEGTAEYDLTTLRGVSRDGGLLLPPPGTRGNVQRLFLPVHALRSVEVLGWISTARKTGKGVRGPGATSSGTLFPDDEA